MVGLLDSHSLTFLGPLPEIPFEGRRTLIEARGVGGNKKKRGSYTTSLT